MTTFSKSKHPWRMKPFPEDMVRKNKNICRVCKKDFPRDTYHFYYNSRGLGDGFERVCRKCIATRNRLRNSK